MLEFRESAVCLGLVRKYRGRLLATARGRKLRKDPVTLWWHLAQSVPLCAADAPRSRHAGPLWRAGWARHDGTELKRWDARAHLVISLVTPIVGVRRG